MRSIIALAVAVALLTGLLIPHARGASWNATACVSSPVFYAPSKLNFFTGDNDEKTRARFESSNHSSSRLTSAEKYTAEYDEKKKEDGNYLRQQMDDEPDRAGATAAEFASNASTLVDSSVTETELDDAPLADVVVQAADGDDGSPSSSTGGGAEKSDDDCVDDEEAEKTENDEQDSDTSEDHGLTSASIGPAAGSCDFASEFGPSSAACDRARAQNQERLDIIIAREKHYHQLINASNVVHPGAHVNATLNTEAARNQTIINSLFVKSPADAPGRDEDPTGWVEECIEFIDSASNLLREGSLGDNEAEAVLVERQYFIKALGLAELPSSDGDQLQVTIPFINLTFTVKAIAKSTPQAMATAAGEGSQIFYEFNAHSDSAGRLASLLTFSTLRDVQVSGVMGGGTIITISGHEKLTERAFNTITERQQGVSLSNYMR